MATVRLDIDDDHPLALELSSLRSAVARFQHEAHTSALKLQRHSLEAAMAIERAQALEHENTAARAELVALRAHPDSTPHPAELQLPEFTLALRQMQGAASRAHFAAESAFGVAAVLARERALLLRLRAAEEEGRMMDRAVTEYADLLAVLAPSQPPLPPPKDSIAHAAGRNPLTASPQEQNGSGTSRFEALQEQKAGLYRLVEEFEGTKEALRDEIGKVQIELEGVRTELEAERKGAEEEHQRLTNALTELERLKHDDNAAAKMVSRYMKFSQTTTDTLQRALESLTARHAATTSTLHTQLAAAQAALATEQRQTARLRDVLDEATEQLARETYGRRREIALRLAVVGREDQLAEALRRWVRRAQETHSKEDRIVRDAGELLTLVDGAASRSDIDAGTMLDQGIGSVARVVAAQDAVKALVEELQVETERRMKLERILGRAEVDDNGRVIPPQLLTSAPRQAIPEVVKVDAATSPICPSPSQGPGQVTENSPEDPVSSEPPLADLSVVLPQTKLTPLEHMPTTVTVLHQPIPRSSRGSPAFLSPRSSPSSSSSSVSTPANTHSTLSPSLPLQDTTSASTNTSEPDTTKSPSSPAGSSSALSSQHYSPSNLLAELGKTKSRYDELQRAFRDCHLALRELSQSLELLPPSSSSALPTTALQTMLSRLDDFNEDARVELEIRIADEERVARGYATLLTVPGAITSAAEAQDGTDATVARAQSQFARKREDLEHDVAALKRAVHAPPQTQTQMPAPPSSSSPSSRPATPSSWTSLAAGLFAPSPTFGAVVTSPRTRRAVSAEAGPLAALQQQLRIPMPELHHHHQAAPSPSSVQPGPRARTTSGMYMLGLGMRGGVVVPAESRKASVVGTPQRLTEHQDAEDFGVE
ncbi:hypothetical protein BC826DRAFT_1014818 [Russula brevipes]|nr:hypothetical protein BC826DRAFT_1014818 [Russula brevipes]